jgi:hypothetical protein
MLLKATLNTITLIEKLYQTVVSSTHLLGGIRTFNVSGDTEDVQNVLYLHILTYCHDMLNVQYL